MDDANLIDISAMFDLSIGKHTDRMTQSLRQLMQQVGKMNAQPVFSNSVKVETASAAGVCVMSLEGPISGYLTQVHSIAIGGLTPSTTAAGRADIYVTAANFQNLGTSPGLGLGDWRDYTTTLPATAFYSKEQIVLHNPEKLLVIITGATAGQQYVGRVGFSLIADGNLDQSYSF